jgi:carbonic anhydrase
MKTPAIKEHSAKNVFFSCIDDRLSAKHSAFVKTIGGAFCPSLAGGALAFVLPEQRDIALLQVVAAYKINQINHVYLESHTDCGAYKLAGIVFKDQAEETKRLRSDLERAKSEVQSALTAAGAKPGEVEVVATIVSPSED